MSGAPAHVATAADDRRASVWRALRELVPALAAGADDRDRRRVHPVEELREVARTGVLGLLVPESLGGPGGSLSDAGHALRLLAAADPSIAQVLQPHFVTWVAALMVGLPDQRRLLAAEALSGARFGNALSERGTRHSMDLKARLHREGNVAVLRGRKSYCTGSLSADWVPTYALDEEGRMVLAFVPRHAKGLQVLDDWQGLGQRGTASGSVVLDDVVVEAVQVLELWQLFRRPQVWNAFTRFLHAAIDVGIAEGALQAGARWLRTRARPWVEAGVERASDEPHVLLRYGQLRSEVAAADALLRRAAEELDAAHARGLALEEAQAARVSAAISEAKAHAAETAVLVATAVFDASGASAADESSGLGRHWRDARTHSVHDPVRWTYHAAGHYAVHGDFPRSGRHGGAAVAGDGLEAAR